MNKADLVEAIVNDKSANVASKAAAEKVLNAVLEGIKSGLKKDGSVQLIGFGTFQVKNRSARTGRNPQTGEKIKIKASKTVGFKCGAALKNLAKKTK